MKKITKKTVNEILSVINAQELIELAAYGALCRAQEWQKLLPEEGRPYYNTYKEIHKEYMDEYELLNKVLKDREVL